MLNSDHTRPRHGTPPHPGSGALMRRPSASRWTCGQGRVLGILLCMVLAAPLSAQSLSADTEAEPGRSIRLYQGEPEVFLALQKADLIQTASPAALIVVGDPSIADATLVSDTVLLLTARSVGSTNLLVLDDAEQIILETVITVREEGIRRITIRRAGALSTYLCGENTGCVPTSTLSLTPAPSTPAPAPTGTQTPTPD